jgi:PIN domain nuclease of toxin-antitoxin system
VTILLDTQVWLWWTMASTHLKKRAHDVISDGSNRIVFSAASAWEIAIKYHLGKLQLPMPPSTYIASRLRRQGFEVLNVEVAHAAAVANLPDHNRDPFDRLLVAQAQLEGMTLMTADRALARYSVARMQI